MNCYRIYTETTTGGTYREVYGVQGGSTGDVFSIEYHNDELILPYGILPKNPLINGGNE